MPILLQLIFLYFCFVYTNELLAELVSCEKVIVEPPSRDFKTERRNSRKNFTLSSKDGKYNFSCFFRQSTEFPENFSCGLDYNPKEERGSIILLRCNGKHGGTKENPHHAYNHIHRPSADRINAGIKVESDITEAAQYATFEQAIQYFIQEININQQERAKYFPHPTGDQISFDF